MSDALTPTLLIGDTHADLDLYFRVIAEAESRHGRLPSVMVGDFGFGHLSPREARTVERFHRANPRHRFLRGNHDHPAIIADAPGFLVDGTVSGSVLILGGADGGLPGWRTEMTAADMARIREHLATLAQPPHVVISHDAPQEAAVALAAARGLGTDAPGASRTRQFLSEVMALLRPELWIFGHWHHAWEGRIGETHLRGMGFGEAFVLPLPWTPTVA